VFDKNCASCHVGGNGTDNDGGKLHPASDTGVDGAYAQRTRSKAYRTTPLRGLWQHPPYFHDGSARELDDVVDHYNDVRKLELSSVQRKDLVEYLKTL
jgi:cytochrome c peroxidase